ncbi:MAG: hypothetical protein ACFFD1_07435, partial [Candidatus Thorarchaeota archaeon]
NNNHDYDLQLTSEEKNKINISEYKEFFKFCFNTGIPESLIKNIYTKFIPKYKPTNLNINNNLLFGIFSAFESGIIKQKDVINILFYNQVFPDLTLEELIWNNLPNINLEKEEIVSEEEKAEEQSLDSDIVLLSFKNNIGVKFNLNDINIDIIFYQGQKIFDQKTISFDISEVDLKYLLVFEVKFPIKENLPQFVEETAKIILNELVLIKPAPELPSEEENVTRETSPINEPEIKNFISEKNLSYKVVNQGASIEIQFFKNDRNFGKIRVLSPVTAPEIYRQIKDKTLISTLVNEDQLMFASLELFNNLEKKKK